MKPGLKAIATGRTMRVATLFTGAAACATAFAPTAMAGTAHPAQPNAGRSSGSIQQTSNCAAVPHWLHISVTSLFGTANWCYGYRGTWHLSWHMVAQCGGNNYGVLVTDVGDISYGPGTYYRRLNHSLYSIENEGWYTTAPKKNDTCPSHGPGQ